MLKAITLVCCLMVRKGFLLRSRLFSFILVCAVNRFGIRPYTVGHSFTCSLLNIVKIHIDGNDIGAG